MWLSTSSLLPLLVAIAVPFANRVNGELARGPGWTYKNNGSLVVTTLISGAVVAISACQTGQPVVASIGVTYASVTFLFSTIFLRDYPDMEEDLNQLSDVRQSTPEKTLVQRLESGREQGKRDDDERHFNSDNIPREPTDNAEL